MWWSNYKSQYTLACKLTRSMCSAVTERLAISLVLFLFDGRSRLLERTWRKQNEESSVIIWETSRKSLLSLNSLLNGKFTNLSEKEQIAEKTIIGKWKLSVACRGHSLTIFAKGFGFVFRWQIFEFRRWRLDDGLTVHAQQTNGMKWIICILNNSQSCEVKWKAEFSYLFWR